MEREIKVACPCCGSILVVDRVTGELLETRKPLVEKSSGDRLQDAFLKAKQDKERLADAFDDVKAKQALKKKQAEDLFAASLEEAKKNPQKKPRNIFDTD